MPLIAPKSTSGEPFRCTALVAIPTFEAGNTIEATLASVEASIRFHRDAGSNDEVVISVVDDASGDDTVSRVRTFAEHSDSVVLVAVQPVNRGRAAARNRALAAAEAEAFLFLDHDDHFHPEHVRLCLEALKDHPRADYVETDVELSHPVHRDWRSRIAASLTQNLCVRARCHRLIGGFHEEPEVEAYGCDDVLYNRTLHALFRGVRIADATVRFNRKPGNSFDRQYEQKLSRPVEDARPTTSAAQRELAGEVIALQERRQAEVRQRLGAPATPAAPAAPAGQCTAPFNQEHEPIFAMMVTGDDPSRTPLARVAVGSFAAQDHGNRILVVVKSGDHPLDLSAIPEAHRIVIHPPGPLPLGELRNLGLDAIPAGALWTYWDDDDWHPPSRLTAQRKVLDVMDVPACLLTRQVTYSLPDDIAYVTRASAGFPATLLSRKHRTLRFPPLAVGEDSAYLDALKQEWSWYPWNNPRHLILRFFYGANTCPPDFFGLRHRSPGTWTLPPHSAEVLHQVLGLYRRQGVPVREPSDVGDPRAVILSTGRAGSFYIAALLTAAGIRCGHEAVFHFERRHAPGLLVDSSWLALPYVEAGDFDGRVFHQVRHPLNVLSSLLNGQMQADAGRAYAHFQHAHLHGSYPDDGDYLQFAVRFLVDWNRRCEQAAERTWRLEDVDLEVIRTVAAAVNRPLSIERAERALRRVSRTANKHPVGPTLTWGDLAHVGGADELREQARRYGYG